MVGCNVDLRERYGATALYTAAKCGYVEICELLLKAGAGVDITNTKNRSPLLGMLVCFVYWEIKYK